MMYRVVLLLLFLSLTGCAAYQTPGAGVSLADLTTSSAGFDATVSRQPTAAFPARIALVRVQAADYGTTNPACHGTGRYCVMTVRNIESARNIERLQQLPQVAGVESVPLGRVPQSLNTVDDLRPAAEALNADLLLLYTLDTRFTVDQAEYDPLAVIKPGFLPNRGARVTTKTSGELVDVRSGFVYGRSEVTSWRDQNAAVWATRTAIEDERRITERASFELFVNKFESLWRDVVATHGIRSQ
jgi:hypothetical protein